MTEHAAGGETHDQTVSDTEKVHRNVAREGTDLNDPMALAGFFGSMAALLALTQGEARLPKDQAAVHAQAMLDLVDALAVKTPSFNAGWDALLAYHSSLMKRAVQKEEIAPESKDILFDVAARLLHNG